MLHTLKIYTTDLEIGMYVSGLDRPWLETPFTMQGFRLENAQDVDRIRNYCEWVFVDARKSRQDDSALLHKVRTERPPVPIERIFVGRTIKPYENTSEWKAESAQAWLVLDSLLGPTFPVGR